MSLTLLDGLILVVVAGGLIRGFMVGAIRQVTSLVGMLVAFLLSIQLMHPIGSLIASYLSVPDSLAPILGFAVLFFGLQLLAVALSRLLEQILETLSLTLVNRTAGGALGAFKAALLLSVLFLVLSGFEMPAPETRSKSALYGPVAAIFPITLDVASEYLPAARRASETFSRKVRPRLPSSPQTNRREGADP